MSNLLLTAILVCNLAFIAGFTYAIIKIRSLNQEFRDFITPAGENQPSKLALTTEAISEILARAITSSVKGFLMGAKSGEARAETAENIAQIGQSPLGAIMGLLPKSVTRSLAKNPFLLDYALKTLNPAAGGGSSPSSAAGGNGHNQVKFKL